MAHENFTFKTVFYDEPLRIKYYVEIVKDE